MLHGAISPIVGSRVLFVDATKNCLLGTCLLELLGYCARWLCREVPEPELEGCPVVKLTELYWSL